MIGLTAKAFSSLQCKELKTKIFRNDKPESILYHLLKLYTRGDNTYSIRFGSIEIIVVCDVTRYNLVEMYQFLWRSCYVHIQDRMVSHATQDDQRKHVLSPFRNQIFHYSVTHSLDHSLQFDLECILFYSTLSIAQMQNIKYRIICD
jgi:hypothetical protein